MDKKHEDVSMVAQIDKTSVFQEGMRTADEALLSGVLPKLTFEDGWLTSMLYSTGLQSKPYITAEMQGGTLLN